MLSARLRLEKALESEGLHGAVITSAENIRYFSGFTSEDGWLFVGQGRSALVTDSRYWAQAEVQCPDVELIKFNSHKDRSLASCLAEWLKENKLGGKAAFEGSSMSYDDFSAMQEELVNGGACEALVSRSHIFNEMRILKTEAELKAIAKSSAAADKAWKEALPYFKEGITEADFCAELEYRMHKCGARKPSFDTIVASGINGAYPHAVVTDRVIKRGELVTVDFGCIVDGWCSDITRTVWIGELDKKSAEIWSIVRRAHDAALEAAKPGLTGSQLDGIARNIITEAGYGEYFSHSLGHGVGLAVHEGPRLRRESSAVMHPGMTTTIEPGIYIPGLCGCRIEDLIYISEDGFVRLSNAPYQVLGQEHPLCAY